MANTTHITQELLCELLDYNPETGELIWKRRGIHWFSDDGEVQEFAAKRWNNRLAGKPAFRRVSSSGYLAGSIFNLPRYAHRVIWIMVHGTEPVEVDHINGDRTDNRIANLRAVTKSQNQRNKGLAKTNTSGFTGVFWNRTYSKWQATIRLGNKRPSLGMFDRKEDAIAARIAANIKHGFHPNHGDNRRVNRLA